MSGILIYMWDLSYIYEVNEYLFLDIPYIEHLGYMGCTFFSTKKTVALPVRGSPQSPRCRQVPAENGTKTGWRDDRVAHGHGEGGLREIQRARQCGGSFALMDVYYIYICVLICSFLCIYANLIFFLWTVSLLYCFCFPFVWATIH